MNSHEYANKLKKIGDFLLARPSVEFDSGPKILVYFGWGKDKFIAAAKAMGSITKTYKSEDFEVSPVGHPELVLYAARSVVCRKVQDEKWECEPLLSQAEEAEIGA